MLVVQSLYLLETNPVQENSEVLIMAVRVHAQINLFNFLFLNLLSKESVSTFKNKSSAAKLLLSGVYLRNLPFSLDQEIPELLLKDLQPIPQGWPNHILQPALKVRVQRFFVIDPLG